jgi:hypothetical protein
MRPAGSSIAGGPLFVLEDVMTLIDKRGTGATAYSAPYYVYEIQVTLPVSLEDASLGGTVGPEHVEEAVRDALVELLECGDAVDVTIIGLTSERR